MIRLHRVRAFVDWVKDEPADGPPLMMRPQARFFRDLTQQERAKAAEWLRELAAADLAEADRLERQLGAHDDGPAAA